MTLLTLLKATGGGGVGFRSSTSITPGSGTSAAPAVPSGAAIGDIAVVGLYMESTATVTPPSGFTQKANLQTSATAQGRLVVYWKRLTAADSGTYSFTWSGATWRGAACGLWSGRVATGDPFDGTVGTAESASTVTTLNVSTSPSGSNGDAVGFWTNFNGGATFTPPTNYTERVDTNVITLDTRDAVSSGTTGNVTATSNITDWMKAFLGVLAEASSGVTGTAAITQGGDTPAASGQLGYSGTSAATEAADTSSASGTVVNPVTGTAAVTQASQTASASGQLGYSGSAAITQAANTSSASGQLGYSGTAASTQANQTSSASGQLGYTGTLAATQAAETSSAAGTFTGSGISGNAAATQAAQTTSASGTFTAGSVSGSAAVTQANQTSTASGKLGYSGTAAPLEANDTSAAAGTVINPITGTASPTQASQFSIANGILRYTGSGSIAEAPDTSTASGTVSGPITGTGSAIQANQIVVAAGTFAPLVSLGTASGAVGPTAKAVAAVGVAPSASSGVMPVPTATGG